MHRLKNEHIMADFFKAKYITLLISFSLILGAGVGALLYYVFPQYYPQWYLYIVLFFFIIELALIFIIENGSKKLEQKKMVNLYMATRVSKIILSLAFVGIYALTVKTGIKNFAIIFLLFYFFSILFETYYMIKVERRTKEKHLNS